MYDVTALGEVLMDFTPQPSQSSYPTFTANPGGAPGNFLAALTARGCQCAMLGKVGDDAFGRLLRQTLQALGIDTQGLITDPAVFTTLAFVTLDEHGERDFSFARKPGADTCLRFEELPLETISQSRVFHFGTLSLTADPAKTATQKAVAYAKSQGKIISFDPNLRRPLWQSEDTAKEAIRWGLTQADIVKLSDEEGQFLFGETVTPEETARRLHHDFAVTATFVTLGAKGCYYSLRGQGGGYVPAPDGIRPVDTTGAGDIFGGTALALLLQTGKPLDGLTVNDLKHAATTAVTAASLSTQTPGGLTSVPTPEAVSALL